MRVRSAVHGFISVALGASLVLAAAPQERDYAGWYGEMVDAYQRGDWAAMTEAGEGALWVRPGFPTMMVNVAMARARNGEGDQALELLEAVANMGLTYPIEGGDRFASIAATPRFREIADRMRANGQPAGDAEVAFTLAQRDFFPEGLAAAGEPGTFFVGSVRGGAIVRVDSAGTAQPFANARWSVMGLRVDRERGLLWAAVSALAQRRAIDETALGRAGVAAFDLSSGEQLHEYLLPDDGAEHVVGDLVVDDDGSVYATDSVGGGVWVLRPAAGELRAVVAAGALASPQGLDIAADGNLYVADYNGGIFRVAPRVRQVAPLRAPEDVCVYGIDGLYFYGGDLIAVQNGISPHRVIRLRLDADGKTINGAEVLLRADPRFGEPTLGAVVGARFFVVANSPWAHFRDVEQPPQPASLPVPTVLALSLKRR